MNNEFQFNWADMLGIICPATKSIWQKDSYPVGEWVGDSGWIGNTLWWAKYKSLFHTDTPTYHRKSYEYQITSTSTRCQFALRDGWGQSQRWTSLTTYIRRAPPSRCLSILFHQPSIYTMEKGLREVATAAVTTTRKMRRITQTGKHPANGDELNISPLKWNQNMEK